MKERFDGGSEHWSCKLDSFFPCGWEGDVRPLVWFRLGRMSSAAGTPESIRFCRNKLKARLYFALTYLLSLSPRENFAFHWETLQEERTCQEKHNCRPFQCIGKWRGCQQTKRSSQFADVMADIPSSKSGMKYLPHPQHRQETMLWENCKGVKVELCVKWSIFSEWRQRMSCSISYTAVKRIYEVKILDPSLWSISEPFSFKPYKELFKLVGSHSMRPWVIHPSIKSYFMYAIRLKSDLRQVVVCTLGRSSIYRRSKTRGPTAILTHINTYE